MGGGGVEGAAWGAQVSPQGARPAWIGVQGVGYWIENADAWRARYHALDDNIKRSLEPLRQSDRPKDEIEAVYDEQLTALRL
jgi:hypothetical protein